MAESCDECGAPISPGKRCRDQFDALLAREWQVPSADGPVTHFYLVSSYALQHPDSMGYTRDALEGLLAALRDVLNGTASIDDVRRRAREGAAMAGRIRREPGDPPPVWKRGEWSKTAADLCAVADEDFSSSIEEWAQTVARDA